MKRGLALLLIIMATLMIAGCQGEVSPPPITPPTAPSTPPSEPAQGLFLEVAEPQDESVINTSPVYVRGNTSPDAEVSVNGELIDVDEQGNFVAMVEMEEGPNAIEIIATDYQENEESIILAVIYAP